MKDTPVIDIHSHTGVYGRKEVGPLAEGMREAGLDLTIASVVADNKVIKRDETGLLRCVREPDPDELYDHTWQQLDRLDAAIEEDGLDVVLDAGDLGDRPAVIKAIEGGDYLEGDLKRVEEAYARGVRSMQPVHYRINELGDIQTEPARHGKLTDFGREYVAEMNRLGMIIDLAHATEAMTRDVVAISKAPVMISHTCLQLDDDPHPRMVTAEHARAVAEAGGVIGVWACGFRHSTLKEYVEQIHRLVEAVGEDHVCIGTDQFAGAAKKIFPDFRPFGEIPDMLAESGYSATTSAKVLGGNFLRLFADVRAAAA